jgi:uncharacterized coiled-coil protein SlyX
VVITYPDNTAVGEAALVLNTGEGNTATGFRSLLSNAGGQNTGNGAVALHYNTTGSSNTATGYGTLFFNTTGSYNTANGTAALQNNTTGRENTAIGYLALSGNTMGNWNTATGENALFANSTGTLNTATGVGALRSNTAGNYNVALGYFAGANQTDGNNNVYIGFGMAGVAGEDNSCYIGNIYGQTSSGGTPVYINNVGKLGTTTSSRRFKKDIKPMNSDSETLFALRPVTFRYKKEIDSQGIPQFGLIAEDVEKVNPDLVVRDKNGNVNTVRYEQINSMLLNEFLKEHRRVETQQTKIENQEAAITELKSTVAQQQKGMEVLTTQLKEQAAQIQKVSAKVEMTKPASQLVTNKP